jgi:hypothetical protein
MVLALLQLAWLLLSVLVEPELRWVMQPLPPQLGAVC